LTALAFGFHVGGPSTARAQGAIDPSSLPIPVIERGAERHVRVAFHFSDEGVSVVSTTIGTGAFRRGVGDPDMIRADRP
jgi:hypothetical protein